MNIDNLLDSWLREANKIAPYKVVKPILILMGVVVIVVIMGILARSFVPNDRFKQLEINGMVDSIVQESKNNYYFISGTWYSFKDECVKHMSKGDSVVKLRDSYVITIYDDSRYIKWQSETKHFIFEDLGNISKFVIIEE